MSAPLITSTVINVSLLMILCIGFTFTFMIEKFPNFAHTGYASIGTMITFYLVRFQGFNPYAAWPVATLCGGVVGVILYLGLVKPVKARGLREITLTFTFYIISQMISSVLAIFSYWLLVGQRISSAGFLLRAFDFSIEGVPGIGVTAPIVVLAVIILLSLFLYRSKFGIAMRATTEDEELAANLGVNVDNIHIASWFISGALSGLAGAMLPMWRATSINFSDELLVMVMAGSVMGGLGGIYGAIIGGLLVATSQKLLTYLLIQVFGIWIANYEALMPMIILFTVLAIEPNGLMAINIEDTSIRSIRESLARLRKALWNLLTTE
jgi:branched-chain amino acid transport system permease protein